MSLKNNGFNYAPINMIAKISQIAWKLQQWIVLKIKKNGLLIYIVKMKSVIYKCNNNTLSLVYSLILINFSLYVKKLICKS